MPSTSNTDEKQTLLDIVNNSDYERNQAELEKQRAALFFESYQLIGAHPQLHMLAEPLKRLENGINSHSMAKRLSKEDTDSIAASMLSLITEANNGEFNNDSWEVLHQVCEAAANKHYYTKSLDSHPQPLALIPAIVLMVTAVMLSSCGLAQAAAIVSLISIPLFLVGAMVRTPESKRVKSHDITACSRDSVKSAVHKVIFEKRLANQQEAQRLSDIDNVNDDVLIAERCPVRRRGSLDLFQRREVKQQDVVVGRGRAMSLSM